MKTPKEDMHFQLIKDTKVQCKNNKLIIPASLRHRVVSWYHHYLQHPSHLHLNETMRSVMYWKGMCNAIRSYVKSSRSCQINKRQIQKTGFHPVWDTVLPDLPDFFYKCRKCRIHIVHKTNKKNII